MIKIAMIGAGSVVFSRNLTGDILSYPQFRNAHLSYMDVDADRLEVGAALCRKVARGLDASPTIVATTDRRKALEGADFIINMVQVGGFDSTLIDFEIPRKYGLKFTIADTTGPGGLFRALRTYPVLTSMCQEIAAVAPAATLLNYSNPMSMNMRTIARATGVRAVGLCHSVQGTLCELMHYLGERPTDIAFTCAGINHMAFYLRLEKAGVDLYPRLFEAMERPDVYDSNRVRFELMRRLGYFVTESSEHNAEYSPYFLSHGPRVAHAYAVPVDEYLRRCDAIVTEFEKMKSLCESDGPLTVVRSPEYGSTIIRSMVDGVPSVVYGNMPNGGAIRNLPPDAIVEAATLVDRAGLRLTTVGDLPPQLVAYITPHIHQHELFIRAAAVGRRDHVYQAAMFDPLTAATVPLDQIVELCDELIAAHGFVDQGGLLPRFDGKRTLVPTSGKPFAAADAAALRRDWSARRERLWGGMIRDWHVIGPFPTAEGDRNGLSFDTSVDAEIGSSAARPPSLTRTHEALPAGQRLRWGPARADERGFVDLARLLGAADWSVAYAQAQVDWKEDVEAYLSCGSDDGIRVWLNGVVVHSLEIGRGHREGTDSVPVRLRKGCNQLLVKVDNYTGAWGFSLSVLPVAQA